MSNGRRQVLPLQKGTELFPKVMQQPAKLVIRGVPPETPLYHAVASTYAGRLKVFHAKAQQAYSLSNNQVSKQRFDWGDGARATYTNVQGQETLELEVSVATLQQIYSELPTQQKQYRDVILLSFEYDGMMGIGAAHAAYSVAPGRSDPFPTVLGPTSLVAAENVSNMANDGTRKPLLSFPPTITGMAYYSVPFVSVAANGKQRSTLLLDTRAIPNLPVYVVDIYAQLYPDADIGATCDQIAWSLSASDSGVTDSENVSLIHEWQTLDSFTGSAVYPTDYYIPVAAAPEDEDWDGKRSHDESLGTSFSRAPSSIPLSLNYMLIDDPRIPFNWDGFVFSTSSHFGADGNPPTVATHYDTYRETHATPTGGGVGTYSWANEIYSTSVSKDTWHPVYGLNQHPSAVSKTCTVSGALIDGEKLGISVTSGGGETTTFDHPECGSHTPMQNFNSFEIPLIYPREPAAQKLGTAIAHSDGNGTDGSIANHLGMQFLCRITYDREHDALSMTTKLR